MTKLLKDQYWFAERSIANIGDSFTWRKKCIMGNCHHTVRARDRYCSKHQQSEQRLAQLRARKKKRHTGRVPLSCWSTSLPHIFMFQLWFLMLFHYLILIACHSITRIYMSNQEEEHFFLQQQFFVLPSKHQIHVKI